MLIAFLKASEKNPPNGEIKVATTLNNNEYN